MVGVPGSSAAAASGDEGGHKCSVLCSGVYSRLHPDKGERSICQKFQSHYSKSSSHPGRMLRSQQAISGMPTTKPDRPPCFYFILQWWWLATLHHQARGSSDPLSHLDTLCDSITVMKIFHHHNGSTIYNILCHLLYYGIPFSTVIPKDTLPPPLPFHGVLTLGWCPVSHHIKPSEYTFYHNQLLYFFKQLYSYAAFGMGGIVWHLACTMVSDNLADSLVINRPSDAVGNSHSTECFTNRSILCDDSFTEQELDFICGIYKIVTGNMFFFFAVNYLVKLTCLIIIGHVDQTANVSWWPKHNTFMRFSLWQGYWSPAYKARFQDQLSCIKDQSATLWAVNQWTMNILQYARKIWDFLKLNANATHKFLLSLDGQQLA